MSKKKLLSIIFGALSGVLAITAIVLAFLLNYDQVLPKKIQIIDDGQQIFFKSDYNENYHGYRFKFTSSTQSFTFDSQSNLLALDDIVSQLSIGENYQLSSCFLGDNEGGNTAYSEEVSWKAYNYLSKPELTFNHSQNVISWQAIEKADYYKVYYDDQIIKQEGCTFDLNQINGGNYTFTVVAVSDNVNFHSSKSSPLDVVFIKNFKPLTTVTFDRTTFELTILAEESLKSINAYLDEQTFTIENLMPIKIEEGYLYNINLKGIYQGQTKIGASAATIYSYNRYNGKITYED